MTADVELPAILRDIAAGRRNSVGDYWSRDYCNQAAAEIEALQMEIEALRAEVAQVREAYENRTRDYYAQGDAYDILRARAERLAEALRDLLSRAPGGYECGEFHHSKDDRHGPLDACPPMQRWHAALDDARAALRDHDQEVGNG